MFVSTSNKTFKDTIGTIYGVQSLDTLIPLNFSFEISNTRGLLNRLQYEPSSSDKSSAVSIEGYISKPIFGQGRSSTDRQHYYINSRPCSLPHLSRAINEVYRTFNTTQSPFVLLNLKLDPSGYDVNVSPDKRTLLIHGETRLVEVLRENLMEEFESVGHAVPKNVRKQEGSREKQGKLFSSMIAKFSNSDKNNLSDEEESEVVLSQAENEKNESVNDNQDDLREQSSVEAEASTEQEQESNNNLDVDTENKEQESEVGNSDSIKTTDIIMRDHNTSWAPSENESEEESDLFVTSATQELLPTQRRVSQRAASTVLIESSTKDQSPSPINKETTEALFGMSKPVDFDYNEPLEVTYHSNLGTTTEKVHICKHPSRKLQSQGRTTEKSQNGKQKLLKNFGNLVKYVVGPDNEEIDIDKENNHLSADAEETQEKDETIEKDQDQEQDKTTDITASMLQRTRSGFRTRTHNLELPVSVSIDQITKRAKKLKALQQKAELISKNKRLSKPQTAILADINVSDIAGDEELVEGMLNLSIHKNDFLKMEIVGQFNLGFIVVTKLNENTGQKDLFIVDQHASDEIFNFERLQRETVIQKQPMVV